ncbi:MAG: 5-aminolevulinate synthase, partial [Hyphomicrobiaceae bacterium]|nr:5-aminolevulinate synthase [Hyphomicrobiaceae bacterium]
MDYRDHFDAALRQLHEEGRYRVFADLKRRCGAFPSADHVGTSQKAAPAREI